MQLHYLETHLVDHCNLKCKGCGHFSSLSEKRYTDVDIFKRDLMRLSGLFDNISRIRLMGGEPLLHPDVLGFVKSSRLAFPNADIWVVTNGLLLHKQSEEFWQECSRNRVILEISGYPIKLDFEAIEKNSEKYDVRIHMLKTETFLKVINPVGDSNPATAFRLCQEMFKCPFLQEGRIFPCGVPALIHIFNKFFEKNIPVSELDYIDIHDDIKGSDILDFLNRPIPMCRWCLLHRPVFEWGITQKKMDEWVDTNPGLAKRLFGIPRKRYYNYPTRLRKRIEHEARKLLPNHVRAILGRW